MIKDIRGLMREMKERYDRSESKETWRVLQGMGGNRYDTFVLGDGVLWQIKAEEVAPNEMLAVGTKITRFDEEVEKIMGVGSPVPFGTITPQGGGLSIIMAGIQMFSSDSASQLVKNYLSSKQEALESKLRQQIESLGMDKPFLRRYREHRERLLRPYI